MLTYFSHVKNVVSKSPFTIVKVIWNQLGSEEGTKVDETQQVSVCL